MTLVPNDELCRLSSGTTCLGIYECISIYGVSLPFSVHSFKEFVVPNLNLVSMAFDLFHYSSSTSTNLSLSLSLSITGITTSNNNTSANGDAVKERDLLGRVNDINYENTGIDVTLSLDQANPEKKCRFCGETNTPLWRASSYGPKTACNACGLKYKKKQERVENSLVLALAANSPKKRKLFQ